MPEFVHLHCHTEYSLLDGAIRLKDLCAKAQEFGAPAAAITDHGNLFGAVKFYMMCKSMDLKPILGCEVYVAGTDDLDDRQSIHAKKRYHLVLLAQNLEGWKNLVRIVSFGHLHGFYHKPRVTRALLRECNEGLIALSACLAGEVPRKLMNEGMDAGEACAREYADIFPGRFYLELQSNGLKEQDELNDKLIELAGLTDLPLVATNDCHYLGADDVEAHDILLCIQTAACVDDEKRMRFDTKELYYKSPDEMAAAFAHVPEAIANTVRIADMCDVELDLKTYHFPIYDLPEGKTLHEEFVDLSRAGLDARLDALPYRDEIDEQAYRDRLELELGVIAEMGFEGYFLIVQDFINWAKDNGIPVGPGRGSAAGSLVAWALRITNLDPIPYNLLFERFLNPERVSMPDIDVDFCERRRTEVIKYVSDKYGEDAVGQITTFGTMKAKAVVRDVGRALGMSFGETDRIAKLIPEDLKMTVDKALELEPDLMALYRADDQIRRLLDVSRRLEGLSRHASTHAAGVVIGDKPLTEYLPLYRGKKEEIVTQFDMKMVEKVGLIKFDFLGLRTMTLVEDCLENIRLQGKEAPDLDTMSLDDEATYALFSRGDTDGVFQVESSGMRKYLRMLRPSCFEDVIAMLALYRPGPLGSGMVEEFIERKQGTKEVVYPLPALEDVLKDTYGVIVYQEQVMKIAQVVANYTLGGADLLRRAMGKKNAEAMAEERTKFMKGAKENDISEKKATEIFDLMEQFAAYGFNKSHSAAYALISYYTAYLKVHYPHEFMAALMTSELSNQDKLLKYITACRDMGIPVLPPDVNVSRREFTVRDEKVIFGLGGVKNVGDEAIREIVQAREEGGEYPSLLDMCTRVNLRKVTKRVVENLVKAGACDHLGCSRQGFLNGIEQVVARAQKAAKDKSLGQVSLFTMVKEEPRVVPGLGFECPEQEEEEWDDTVKSSMEKEALGFFLTSHPLMPFRTDLKRLRLTTLEESVELEPKSVIQTALIVTSVKEYITKKGGKMAFCQVEDLTASGECTFFPELYMEHREKLGSDRPLLIKATTDAREEANGADEGPKQPKLLAEEVRYLSDAVDECGEPVTMDVTAAALAGCIAGGVPGVGVDSGGNGNGNGHGNGNRAGGQGGNERLESLRALLARHAGRTPLQLRLRLDTSWCVLQLPDAHRVNPDQAFYAEFQAWARSAGNGRA